MDELSNIKEQIELDLDNEFKAESTIIQSTLTNDNINDISDILDDDHAINVDVTDGIIEDDSFFSDNDDNDSSEVSDKNEKN